MKGKVTGLGGFFITSGDPGKIKKWYEEHLGLPCDEHGHLFKWREMENTDKIGHTQFAVFESKPDYFKPGKPEFMINFRVDNLEAMMDRMKKSGLEIIGEIEKYDYGKFGWVIDPDGNKIELWEPVDEPFIEDQKDNNEQDSELT